MAPQTPAWLMPLTASAPAVAAVVVAPPDGSHVGVAYHDEDGAPRYLHLAFHHKLTRGDLPTAHLHVVSPLDPERLVQVAAMCERVWKRHGRRIPYGFRYDASRFARDGELVLGRDERGFTCATFVLAIYRSVGIDLVQLAGWPPSRDDDKERQADLLAHLATCGDEAHVRAVRREVGAVRYRPAEVAGASAHAPPCAFDDATAAAASILAALASQP